jgi:hypothetical protein
MSAPEREIIGRTAGPLRARADNLVRLIPKHTALSEGTPEHDPEQDLDPAA